MNREILKKANDHKRELKHQVRRPVRTVTFQKDETAFQGLRVQATDNFSWPIILKPHESVILDFGDHCVGYLHFAMRTLDHIADAPLKFRFSFGEFPLRS